MRGLACAVAVAVAAQTAWGHETDPAAGKPRFEPPPAGSYELPPIDRVDEHTLLGSDGAPAPLLGLAPGEVALVSFVYLSCDEACPIATATLHRVDRALAADEALAARARIVTVSFDPARDTPENMAVLERSLKPKSRWRFLTTEGPSALAPILRDFGQDAVRMPAPGDAAANDRLRHVLKVFLVDADRRVRNIYSTGFLDERIVVNDVRTVLAEDAPGLTP